MFSLSRTEPWPRNNIINNKNKNKNNINNNNHKNTNRSAHSVIRLRLYKVASLLAACFLFRTGLVLQRAASGPASVSLQVHPVAFKVFAPSRFKEILDYRTVTAKTYQGLPLADLSSASRFSIRESLVRGLDEKLHPGSVFQDAERGRCVDGRIRCRGNLQYNWQRDGTRVQLKSAQMKWNKTHRLWLVQFQNVKLQEDDAATSNFDELLLALYTPRGILVYQHDLKHCLSAEGLKTDVSGSSIYVCGPTGQTDWSQALDAILQKLDASACQFLGNLSLKDELLSELAADRLQTSLQVFKDLPLADLSSKARGDRLEALVCAVDSLLHPDCMNKDAADAFDWLRGGARIKCKGAQLCWSRSKQNWQVGFYNIKLQAFGIREMAAFDELLLALYTPRGLFIYKHDLEFAVSTQGVLTATHGHVVRIRGPKGEQNWQVALEAILTKFDAESNGCKRLAFVPFRRLKGWHGSEANIVAEADIVCD
ncbi:unnamed protein product [Polarella glacialis]|uniref:Uncharacterized protein n=1 Tax=Polarella glacialis TaxID=89957 RepID=A0A813EKA9_POLGL|nr:unnamed protein product [Polarella glacialis]